MFVILSSDERLPACRLARPVVPPRSSLHLGSSELMMLYLHFFDIVLTMPTVTGCGVDFWKTARGDDTGL
jgi:hypothetical protein